MASLTGQLVAETYKALLKVIDNDVLTASEKQITDGFGGGSNVFIDSNGFLRANKYKITNGLATQFLKADGSLDANTYLTGITSSQIIAALGYTPVTNARTLTINGTTYDLSANRSWTIEGTAAVWGNISGTLSNQTDLQTALNAKFNNPAGTISQYIRGDGSLATFPTITGGLPTGGTAGQILAKIDATNYNTEWIDNYATQTKNEVKLGQTLTKGTPAYVSSADGTNMIVSAASNTTEATSSKTLGLLETGGSTNALVKCVTFGLIAGLDTSTATAGDPVWLGPSGTLLYGIANKPVAPAHMVYIGVVTRVQSNNGEIFVNVQNGFEIEELHDVLIQSKANNQGLFYESSTGLWKNKSIATVLGYTPQAQLDGTGFVKASGTTITYDNSTYLTTTDAASTYQRLDKMVSNLLASATEYPNSNAVINALALKANAANPTFTGDLTISGATPRLYFVDTDQNPDYTVFIDSGFFYIYDQTAGATRLSINSSGNISTGTGKSITAGSFIKESGTASDFLKADGSIDSSTYVTSATLSSYLLSSTAASTYQRLDKMVSNLLASSTEYPNSNAVIAALALKANASNPVFTGNMTISGAEPKLYFVDTDQNPDYTLFVDAGYFYIYDQTAGATRFQINSSGNITTGVNNTITSWGFIKSGGTSSQYLMADGSVSTFAGITGSGTTNYLPKWTSASALGNSILTESANGIGIGIASANGVLQFSNATNTRKIVLYEGANNDFQFYGFGIESSTLVYSTFEIGDDHVFYSGRSTTTRSELARIKGNGNASIAGTLNVKNSSSIAGLSATVNATGEFMSTGSLSGYFWENRSGGVTSGTNWYGWYTTSGLIKLYNGSSNLLSISGTSGNMSIGSDTDAGYKLDVNGIGRFNGNLKLSSGGTLNIVPTSYGSNGFVAFRNIADSATRWNIYNYTINSPTYGSLQFSTGDGVDKLRIEENGAGTFAWTLQASAKLFLQRASSGADTLLQFKNEVGADRAYINFSGTTEELGFYAGNGSTKNMVIGSDGAMGFNYPTLAVRSFMFRAIGGRPLFEIAESGGLQSVYIRPNPTGRHLITSNYLSGGPYLPLALSGRENDGDLVLATSGNILINTATDAGYKLDVNGTSRFAGTLRVDGSAYPFISLVGSDVAYGGGFKFFGSTTQYAEMYGEYESSNNGQMFFRTRRSGLIETALSIKSSGNLGINTTTPLRKLHVVDTSAQIRVSYNDATDARYAEMSWFGLTGYAGDTNNQFNIGFDGGNSANGGINFNTGASGASSTRMRISRGGYIGVNTTDPQAFIHINESTYGNGLLITTSSISGADITLTNTSAGGKRWDITSGGSNNGIGAGGLQFYNNTDGAMRMGISSAGNVLIGSTTDAGYRFQVAGSGHRFSVSPHANGIDMASTGNLAPHYQTDVTFYYGNIGSGSMRLQLSTGGSLTAVGSMTATSFFESSDMRLKTLIDGSAQVAGIENLEAKLYEKEGKIEFGYFAQDAQKYMPYSVSKNTDGFLTLSYREVHTAKIARLEKRVAELEKQLNLN